MGWGRLFSRQKDIPVFIEGVLLYPKEECCQEIWCNGNGEHGIWIGSSSQVSQYLYEFLRRQLCFCFIFLYFCISGPGKGFYVAGRSRLGAGGRRGLCCVGRIHTGPCYQDPQWCHALLHRARYVRVPMNPFLFVSACFGALYVTFYGKVENRNGWIPDFIWPSATHTDTHRVTGRLQWHRILSASSLGGNGSINNMSTLLSHCVGWHRQQASLQASSLPTKAALLQSCLPHPKEINTIYDHTDGQRRYLITFDHFDSETQRLCLLFTKHMILKCVESSGSMSFEFEDWVFKEV